MPFYEYRCERGHTFEVLQRMSEDPVQSCTTCDATVERIFHPVAVHFKGSGFYSTDYGRKKSGASTDSTGDDKEGGKGDKEAGKKGGSAEGGTAAGSKSESASKTASSD